MGRRAWKPALFFRSPQTVHGTHSQIKGSGNQRTLAFLLECCYFAPFEFDVMRLLAFLADLLD
jgi:hypothetical protein